MLWLALLSFCLTSSALAAISTMSYLQKFHSWGLWIHDLALFSHSFPSWLTYALTTFASVLFTIKTNFCVFMYGCEFFFRIISLMTAEHRHHVQSIKFNVSCDWCFSIFIFSFLVCKNLINNREKNGKRTVLFSLFIIITSRICHFHFIQCASLCEFELVLFAES